MARVPDIFELLGASYKTLKNRAFSREQLQELLQQAETSQKDILKMNLHTKSKHPNDARFGQYHDLKITLKDLLGD